jgi:hypothetical protein
VDHISLTRSEIRKGRKKWSARMSSLIAGRGKLWDRETERKLKTIVADAVCADPAGALDSTSTLVSELALALRTRLHPLDPAE